MASFGIVPKGKMGYSKTEVDLLIAKARDQYSNASAHVLDWRELTNHVFTLEKNGYQPGAVDSALQKLQDTFAEKELSIRATDNEVLRQLLSSRSSRRKGRRFQRSSVLGLGYSRPQVDALLAVVGEYLEGQDELDIVQVRELAFKLQRGGYIESQVDAYIDRLVEYIQTKRFAKPVTAYAARPVNVVDGSEYYSQPGNESH